ncbi:DUF4260 domain-containing protein [Nafulsella turpanensis]|uniref:DUF4260 domain-containing protein n=1 Tax=Nafulsella turpanensis TaxID=1265690 RepID=UPI0003469A5E|nr:DUF4260 domain-containing protein [Nafulsella turpanensis]
MHTLLRLEEWAKFLLCFLLSLYMSFDWWLFPALLLLPDLGMLGYLFSPRWGAYSYNFFHHQGIAVLVGVAGLFLSLPLLQLAGLILFGHSAMDRALGYGLKHTQSFRHTHLGLIGRDGKKVPVVKG